MTLRGFIKHVKRLLGKLIEAATGKPVLVSQSLTGAPLDTDIDMDEDDDEYVLQPSEALSAST